MPVNLAAMPLQRPAPLGSVQRCYGKNDAQITFPAANTILSDGAGGNMSISVVPEQRCWWHVEASMIVIGLAASWTRMDWRFSLVPSDLDGLYMHQHIVPVVTDPTWITTHGSSAFKLEANTLYTCSMMSQGPTNTAYWAGPQYTKIFGFTTAEGIV